MPRGQQGPEIRPAHTYPLVNGLRRPGTPGFERTSTLADEITPGKGKVVNGNDREHPGNLRGVITGETPDHHGWNIGILPKSQGEPIKGGQIHKSGASVVPDKDLSDVEKDGAKQVRGWLNGDITNKPNNQ